MGVPKQELWNELKKSYDRLMAEMIFTRTTLTWPI